MSDCKDNTYASPHLSRTEPLSSADIVASKRANSIIPVWQTVAASLVAIILTASFAIVIVFAGHGVVPVGLLLVGGSFSAWGFPMTLGWGGVLLTLTALFCSQTRLHCLLAACGLACIVASWALFFGASEASGLTLVTSIPFLVLSFIQAIHLIVRLFLYYQRREW